MKRQFVRNIAKQLGAESRALLDIGCGDGEIALHLAGLGHQVLGIPNNAEELKLAEKAARESTVSGSCEFVLMDASDMFSKLHRQMFDGVIAINVLHEISRITQLDVIDQAKKLTLPGGLHGVSGYLVDPAETEHAGRRQALRPGELNRYYATDPGWVVVDYHEDTPAVYESAGAEWVNSHANLIARRVARPHLPTDNF